MNPVGCARMDRTAAARQAAVGGAVFAGTLVVLMGLSSVISTSTADPSPSTRTTSPKPGETARPTVVVSPSPSAAGAASPEETGDPVLVGAGDIADCGSDGDEATASLLDDIAGTVFTAGDNVYPGASTARYRDCFEPSWGRHLARTRPAPGNHDWQSGDLAAYGAYFGTASENDGDPWYEYDLGTWQVIVLASDCARVDGCGPESRQGRWLTTVLADSDARCTLAIWHHPRFSSGEHGDQDVVAPFWDALYAAGADVVINGHDHDYERFAPMDPDGKEDRDRGLRQFVVGTGGVPLRDFKRAAPNSELRASVAHGVIALTLRDGSYDWQFIPTAGDFADRGTARCH